jgi:hypothetical protein
MISYDNDNLPLFVISSGVKLIIREKCDYRIVKKTIRALKDNSLENDEKIRIALIVFYENYKEIKDAEDAMMQMYSIIDCVNEYKKSPNLKPQQPKPAIMDWDYDWDIIAPEINRVLGYDIRTPKKYTHWWTAIGAYRSISGESTFKTVITIRHKKQKGKKLEQWEKEFYEENREMVDSPLNLTDDEKEWLDAD